MILTNKYNLPEQFVNAVNKDYIPTPQQYSVTTLLNPSRQVILSRRYNSEIEEDVSDMIYAILGTAFHSLLENSKENDDELKEEYLKQELSCLDERLKDYRLSGKADLYNAKENKIIDFKTTSSFKFVLKDFEDYRMQLLMYAWLFNKIGFKTDKGQIIAILRDWQKSKAKFDSSYPQSQVQTIEFKFTDKDFEEIEKFIATKFIELKNCESLKDEDLPLCSMEDRWNDGNKYAVKKKGNKRADRVFDSEEEAREYLADKENTHEIEVRPGEDRRCLEYCSCCKFCTYWQKTYGQKEEVKYE